MTVDTSALKDRLSELHKQRERAYLTLTAVDGAIQEVEFWLATLERSEDGSKQQ